MMTETLAIEILNLTKRYGSQTALDNLNLQVPKGSIFGFLGPNGAGKTTALKILLGLARPTSGEARVLGASPGTARKLVGFLPDVPAYYDWMTAPEFLRFAASLFGSNHDPARLASLLELTGLKDVNTRIGGFSRGMKQRLGIAQALVNDPEIVFLDEPTSALDPMGRKEVLECISNLKGRTVVFSTHILADVERVCDRIAILNKGRNIAEESIDSLRRKFTGNLLRLDTADSDRLEALLRKIESVKIVSRDESGLKLAVDSLEEAGRLIPHLIAEHDLQLKRFEPLEPSLEDIFIRLVGSDES
jgi:ABC-2 type transport system ATP-binding protein